MCGGYASSRSDDDLRVEFGAAVAVGDGLPPSWNVAPTQQVRAVLERTPRAAPDAAPVRELRSVRWGLVPSWAPDLKIGSRLVNARVETITDKPAFKTAAVRRRCLLPADGYYEWEARPGGGAKTPWFLHAPDGAGVAFAGLYELWPDPTRDRDDPARWVWSATVVTTRAGDALGRIHDRTPLIVPADLHDDWLDPSTTSVADVRRLLDAIPEPHLVPVEVSTAVNRVALDGPDLITPVTR